MVRPGAAVVPAVSLVEPRGCPWSENMSGRRKEKTIRNGRASKGAVNGPLSIGDITLIFSFPIPFCNSSQEWEADAPALGGKKKKKLDLTKTGEALPLEFSTPMTLLSSSLFQFHSAYFPGEEEAVCW